jgi:hypothetical protein
MLDFVLWNHEYKLFWDEVCMFVEDNITYIFDFLQFFWNFKMVFLIFLKLCIARAT